VHALHYISDSGFLFRSAAYPSLATNQAKASLQSRTRWGRRRPLTVACPPCPLFFSRSASQLSLATQALEGPLFLLFQIRLATFSRHGFQQMQVDTAMLRWVLPAAVDDPEPLLSLLDEAFISCQVTIDVPLNIHIVYSI